ncbi:MAG: division/cell wall cluster transcriptional repressor MraZ [Dysgonamonadaceae bacterium]|jgi:MraZ protein|nr:division/cell wall cluster transcriptional repressor MraZ [Dysgonamonadaceae bacterium]
MEKFIGNTDAKVDAKGRIFVPAAFRKILQSSGNSRLMMRKDIFKDCLTLYPEKTWNETLDTLRARLSRWNEEQQDIFRQFVSDAEILEIDTSGRILIPKRYLQVAGITSEVRCIGMSDTIEIWTKSKMEKPLMSPGDFKKGIEKWMSS